MIITKTPFRMSFFGGGSDIPEFFNKNKGSVISTTFDKYVYVTVRHLPRFFEYKNEVIYSKTERVVDLDEIVHPMVRNSMKLLDMDELHIAYDADLPARSGLGTSSTFAVGLLNAFYRLKGKEALKEKLAKDAIHVEREMCNEAGGWQDQIAASFGGFNRIDFYDNKFVVRPINIDEKRKEELDNNLLLFFTGFTRFSADIQKVSKKNFEDKTKELNELVKLVDKAEEILTNNEINIDEFGKLLHHTWELKKATSNVISNEKIDILYEKGIKAGALGGKLLGAGGGGFLLFYVPQNKQNDVRYALKELMEVPFKFENEGTTVIYNEPELFFKKVE